MYTISAVVFRVSCCFQDVRELFLSVKPIYIFFCLRLERVSVLIRLLVGQRFQGRRKSLLLLLFNIEVLFFLLYTVLLKDFFFGFDVVHRLQVLAQLLWVPAKEVKGAGQLVFCVGELLF